MMGNKTNSFKEYNDAPNILLVLMSYFLLPTPEYTFVLSVTINMYYSLQSSSVLTLLTFWIR